MHPPDRSSPRRRPSLGFMLLAGFFAVLWLAGGASQADVAGQVLVRGVAVLFLMVGILFLDRPEVRGAQPVKWFLLACFLLAVVQLIPLPPALWRSLPGRELFTQATMVTGQDLPWRPWTIVPTATVNAAASLFVPIATLGLLLWTKTSDRRLVPGLLLALITAATLIGLIQFSGVRLNNPLINNTSEPLSGIFANRNHFALFLAFGCILAPVWTISGERKLGWRTPVGLALVLLFALAILASGSRAGLILGALALVIGFLLTRRDIGRMLGRYPRWVFPAFIAGILALLAVFVSISVAADRAVSISRVVSLGDKQDLRTLGLPITMEMIRDYFPVGSGLGSFDPVFRLHEPFGFLSASYLNHAHNDFLEVVLDAGLPGLILTVWAVLWWGIRSSVAWRAGAQERNMLPRLGSAMLLLLLVASAFDYPARTPIIMAMAVVAAVWLSNAAKPALPPQDQHL